MPHRIILMMNYLSFQNFSLPESPGIHDITSDCGEVRFSISLPGNGLSKISNITPLVLILHYGGEATPFYGRPLLEEIYTPAWQALGAIMIAPESLGSNWTTEQNETFVLNLFRKVLHNYKCSRSRTLVTGYSAGAIGSAQLALNYPELFSAVIPVAGYSTKVEKLIVPAHFLLSKNDELFPSPKIVDLLGDPNQHPKTKLTIVDAKSHYDVSSYKKPLNDCLDWINSIWNL